MRPPARATPTSLVARTDVTWTVVVGLATALIIVIVLGTPVRSHDLERTTVTLTIGSDGRFDLVVENDPNWLLLRLERFRADSTLVQQSSTTSGSLSATERNAQLAALAPVFIDRVVLFVDGREIRPDSATYVPPTTEEAADGRPARAAYQLSGTLPADARSLRWYYGLVIDPYPITIHRADGRDLSEVVLGDAWSSPLDLAGQFAVPGAWQVARLYFARGVVALLPRGPEHVLFVLALVVGATSTGLTALRLVAFAVGLSFGLSVEALGLTRLPPQLTGQLVAFSILYIGLENLVVRRLGNKSAPIGIAGVVHGLRLAHGVLETDPIRHRLAAAVVSLNLGAAAGELMVTLIGLVCLASFHSDSRYHSRVVVPTSIALVCAGAYWIARSLGPG